MIEDYEVINRFKQSNLLSIDLESCDPNLEEYGPGTHRGDTFIAGVGVATEDPDTGKKFRRYFPLRHPDTSDSSRRYSLTVLKEVLPLNTPKIGANIAYDLELLEHEGIEVGGELHDIQYAEPLLDEYRRSYSLDAIARHYGFGGKRTDVLADYCKKQGWKGKPIKHIWRMPAHVAAEYVYQDISLPLDIFKEQKRLLEQQGLWDIYKLETDLIPILLMMRRNGVRIDVDALKKTTMQVTEAEYRLEQDLYDWAGQEFNTNSSSQIAKILDAKGIPYPRNKPTQKMLDAGKVEGNPNLSKASLSLLSETDIHCKRILDARHYRTLVNLFLHNYALMETNGRLYGSFHPLRSDEYGTVSGRFSASKPNLQQASSKEEEDYENYGFSELTGKIVRKLFIPEDGCTWVKADYSQVEYRLLMHYARGYRKGDRIEGIVEELRNKYRSDKTTDFHKIIMDMTGFIRRIAKNLNFGGVYGIGALSASTLFNWTLEDAETFLDGYHKQAPYIRSTRAAVTKVMAKRHYVTTLLGRRAREHSSRKIYSFFNRLIQGSAADIMKKAMVNCYKAGIYDTLPLHMTVHDEVDVSKGPDKIHDEAVKEMVYLMENVHELKVPLLVDCHEGRNWAEAD